MQRRFVIAGMLGVITVAACRDTTAPVVQHIGTIFQIRVPDHAAFGDTVKIGFRYYTAGCDTGTVVETHSTTDGLRFTVRSFATNRPCFLLANAAGGVQGNPTTDPIVAPSVGYIVAPPHLTPMRLVFSEPDGGDSVRVVGP
ncbi:MAG: hypothetical protein ACJ79K_13110 [Gemmatimonadaceae bacterium]